MKEFAPMREQILSFKSSPRFRMVLNTRETILINILVHICCRTFAKWQQIISGVSIQLKNLIKVSSNHMRTVKAQISLHIHASDQGLCCPPSELLAIIKINKKKRQKLCAQGDLNMHVSICSATSFASCGPLLCFPQCPLFPGRDVMAYFQLAENLH